MSILIGNRLKALEEQVAELKRSVDVLLSTQALAGEYEPPRRKPGPKPKHEAHNVRG
jgi:hypothetical protein